MIRRALSWLLLSILALTAIAWLVAVLPLLLLGALLDTASLRRRDPVDTQWATTPRETRLHLIDTEE